MWSDRDEKVWPSPMRHACPRRTFGAPSSAGRSCGCRRVSPDQGVGRTGSSEIVDGAWFRDGFASVEAAGRAGLGRERLEHPGDDGRQVFPEPDSYVALRGVKHHRAHVRVLRESIVRLRLARRPAALCASGHHEARISRALVAGRPPRTLRISVLDDARLPLGLGVSYERVISGDVVELRADPREERQEQQPPPHAVLW